MKKTIIVGICLSLLFIGIGSSANALTLSDIDYITYGGQSFTFNLSNLETSTGIGTFTIVARGDYTYNSSNEYLNWDIDGIISDTYWRPANADSYTSYDGNDYWWTRSVTIDAATMTSITSDLTATITINNSYAVGCCIHYPYDYVSWTLDYESGSNTDPVPEPATMLLFGTGLAGLAGLRKRNKK